MSGFQVEVCKVRPDQGEVGALDHRHDVVGGLARAEAAGQPELAARLLGHHPGAQLAPGPGLPGVDLLDAVDDDAFSPCCDFQEPQTIITGLLVYWEDERGEGRDNHPTIEAQYRPPFNPHRAIVLISTAEDPVPVVLETHTHFPWRVGERRLWREATDDEYARYYEHYDKEFA